MLKVKVQNGMQTVEVCGDDVTDVLTAFIKASGAETAIARPSEEDAGFKKVSTEPFIDTPWLGYPWNAEKPDPNFGKRLKVVDADEHEALKKRVAELEVQADSYSKDLWPDFADLVGEAFEHRLACERVQKAHDNGDPLAVVGFRHLEGVRAVSTP